MSKNSERLKLGSESPQFNSSKSLLDTINTGFDNSYQDTTIIPEPQLKIENSSREDSMLDTLNTGFGEYNKVIVERPKVEINIEDYTIKICNDDCNKEEVKVTENLVPTVVIKNHCIKREDSIINDLDTGFGPEQTIITECKKKPEFKTHLCKESYLGEFKSEFEKNLARTNLGVYSKKETVAIINRNVSNFITKKEIEEIVKDLDYTTSRSKSQVNYIIPENLFK